MAEDNKELKELERKLSDLSEEIESRIASISRRLARLETRGQDNSFLDFDNPKSLISDLFVFGCIIGLIYGGFLIIRSAQHASIPLSET
jgi:hypothetical protein